MPLALPGDGQGKDHQSPFSGEENLRLRVGGASLRSQGSGSRASPHAGSRHPTLAPGVPPRPQASHPGPRAVPWSCRMSAGLLSGPSSPSSNEDQALSVASVMANCSATPVGTDQVQRGRRGCGWAGATCWLSRLPICGPGDRSSHQCPRTQHCDSLPRPVVKTPPANAGGIRDTGSNPGSERPPGEGHGNPLSILAWKIPWTEERGGLQSTGSQRVRHD